MSEQLKGFLYCGSLREGIYHVFHLKGLVYDGRECDLHPVYPDSLK